MKFTENYEKLQKLIFTTIRKNTGRYKVGNVYLMNTTTAKFKAKVIGLYPIKKEEITESLARVDAGASRERLIQMFENWYGKKFDDYVLITLWAQ